MYVFWVSFFFYSLWSTKTCCICMLLENSSGHSWGITVRHYSIKCFSMDNSCTLIPAWVSSRTINDQQIIIETFLKLGHGDLPPKLTNFSPQISIISDHTEKKEHFLKTYSPKNKRCSFTFWRYTCCQSMPLKNWCSFTSGALHVCDTERGGGERQREGGRQGGRFFN